jgi:23S rRNA (cytidine1920-2'-O)/16S rRNA (cytidine1409-2'-O)-methyltransferase
MGAERADVLLVARGLARSRAQARAAIEAGGVRVGDRVLQKPSEMIDAEADLQFAPAHPWASRAGTKLDAALRVFSVDPYGRIALDIGAAAGGFTDVLLARGAGCVYAVDVGSGQLVARLRNDARVVALEDQDARTLTRALVPEAPTLIVCDASFIGLIKVLARPLALAAPEADLIALVKPQFESGPRSKAKLSEQEARRLAVETAGALDGLSGVRTLGLAESPIAGGAGAREFLLHARRSS